jgi:hypothetical protein
MIHRFHGVSLRLAVFRLLRESETNQQQQHSKILCVEMDCVG